MSFLNLMMALCIGNLPVIELDEVEIDGNLRLPPVIEISERSLATKMDSAAGFSLRSFEKELLDPSLIHSKSSRAEENKMENKE